MPSVEANDDLRAQTAYRTLIAGLAFFEVVHVLGLLSMGTWLLPGIDPSLPTSVRLAYVGAHVWRWRAGWLPWQLSAASDVWVSVALIYWLRMLQERRAQVCAWLGAVCLALAIVPEQWSELRLVTDFVRVASAATWSKSFGLYMWLTGTWASALYTAMTACWLLALGRLRGARVAVLLAFVAASAANHVAWNTTTGAENVLAFQVASVCNGVAFVGLLLLVVDMAITIGASRQLQVSVHEAAAHWPFAGARVGHWLAHIAGASGLRDLLRSALGWLPLPPLRSDVSDVVYLSWLVDASLLEAQLPPGVQLQRFGDASVLSLLVFRHGHFGPAWLGPLRRLLPSPIQCNVRVYLRQPPLHVMFLSTCIDNPLYFVGTRLLCDGLPSHYPASAALLRDGTALHVAIDGGAGSAQTLRAHLQQTDARVLPETFAQCFDSWEHAVRYLVPQNAAVRELPAIGARCETSIVIDAALESVRAARVHGALETGQLAPLVRDAAVFAFVIPHVRFAVTGERTVRSRARSL